MLEAEAKKKGTTVFKICRARTGLTVPNYLARKFNRLAYYEWKRQTLKWKHVKINFWEL
jgi:hypothetical protein